MSKYSLNDICRIASQYFVEHKMQNAWYVVVNFLSKDQTDAWINKDEFLSDEEIEKCMYLLDKLKYNVPMYRVKKYKYFWKDEFFISPYTLEPRPETEGIIEIALDQLKIANKAPKLSILDIGTGTGCILLSLLLELPGSYGIGLDISDFILDTARYNGERLNINGCKFMLKDDFDKQCNHNVSLSYKMESQNNNVAIMNNQQFAYGFDLIVSNPPYVNAEVDYATKFDPISSVFCEDPTAILHNLPLKKGGILLCEVPVYLKIRYERYFRKNYKWHATSHSAIEIFEYLYI